MTNLPDSAEEQSTPPLDVAARANQFAERWALPILFVGVFGAGLSPILVRLAEVGPIATAANRMTLALPFFFFMLWVKPSNRMQKTPGRRRDLWILALSGIFFAGDLAFWNWSVVLTSVANATVLANTTPIFVVLAGWLLFKERIKFQFAVGLALALSGVGVMMSESFSVSAENFTGDIMGFITAWWYAAYIVTVSRVRKRVSTAATMAYGGVVAAIVLWVLAAVLEGNVWPDTARGWTVAIAIALVVQVGGQALIALALAHVPAGLGSMLLFMQPVIAASFAWALFGESLSVWQLIGAAAIIAGIETSRRSHRSKREPAQASSASTG
jgi:drug/metabolite transporter (DMT)-like permease